MNIKATLLQDGITFDDSLFENIDKYKTLLLKWNKVHNLTGIKSKAQLDAFIYDALYPIGFLPKVKTLMDIGTGAGFPGMMLAMGMPDTAITLVEPLLKRASFLQFVKADLGLENVRVENCRVEELKAKSYDIITSRAVTDTQLLLKLSKPFCTPQTQLLFYKGEQVYDEIDETLEYEIIKANKRHYLLIKSPS
ncbi:MAG: 16S rRNA (guanine(527)-N(7))-methyltransferase RsmG [Campylobacterota bacterium]|nr:16S rRNA (guanine(527)-N(7))-methyltransferase RsmG [Campylobacterota bacterium]